MNLLCLVSLMIIINYAKSILNTPKSAIETNKTITPGNIVYKSFANQIFGVADIEKQRTQKYLPLHNSSFSSQSNNLETRPKRNAINLYNMLSCATGCNPIIYKGYGCYCGFLGSGFPVDGIDRCCRSHDWCYVHANCPFYYLEYFIPYYWQCFDNIPICSHDNGIFGGLNSCAARLCECDRRLSNCLKKYACPSYRAYCETSPWRFAQNMLMNF